jgi:hypothetical protein
MMTSGGAEGSDRSVPRDAGTPPTQGTFRVAKAFDHSASDSPPGGHPDGDRCGEPQPLGLLSLADHVQPFRCTDEPSHSEPVHRYRSAGKVIATWSALDR